MKRLSKKDRRRLRYSVYNGLLLAVLMTVPIVVSVLDWDGF